MRWIIFSFLGFVVACGESDEASSPTFTPPTPTLADDADNDSRPAAPLPTNEGAASSPPGSEPATEMSNEDPATAVTGGVMGADEAEPGGASAEPAAESPPKDSAPTTPPAMPEVTTLSTVSTGCGTMVPGGEFSIQLNGVSAAFTVTLPPGYDASTPVPLVFGFHGRNQTHIQFRTQDAANIQTELGGRAVMAYLKSQGGPGWNFPEEVEPNIAFFNAVYSRMLADYCVDTSRIFAVGHSSGGYFANILACRYGDVLRGIGAVAGNTQEFNCVGRVAAMVVHGVRDSVVSFAGGQQSRDIYLAANGCSTESVMDPVSPCVDYQACDDGLPVAWCEHNEPTYQDTNHGWPSFASQAIGRFLFGLGSKP